MPHAVPALLGSGPSTARDWSLKEVVLAAASETVKAHSCWTATKREEERALSPPAHGGLTVVASYPALPRPRSRLFLVPFSFSARPRPAASWPWPGFPLRPPALPSPSSLVFLCWLWLQGLRVPVWCGVPAWLLPEVFPSAIVRLISGDRVLCCSPKQLMSFLRMIM